MLETNSQNTTDQEGEKYRHCTRPEHQTNLDHQRTLTMLNVMSGLEGIAIERGGGGGGFLEEEAVVDQHGSGHRSLDTYGMKRMRQYSLNI